MKAEDIFRDHCEQNTKALFKGFLIILEDLQKEYQINFGKLKRNLPEEFHPVVDQADYFGEEKAQYLRKKTLDIGNETLRLIGGNFENFTIDFHFKKIK